MVDGVVVLHGVAEKKIHHSRNDVGYRGGGVWGGRRQKGLPVVLEEVDGVEENNNLLFIRNCFKTKWKKIL